MSNPFEILNEQHQNIAKLIQLIEREIDRVDDEDVPNVSLLMDIMQYLTRYVDVAHHPLEEALIARYKEKWETSTEEIDECQRQHHSLVDEGRDFMAVVEAVREEQLVERSQFSITGREFVEAQLDHINLEESKVFPELKARLDEKELEAVAAEISSRKDPLFGSIVDKEYQNLYDYILRSA